MSLLLQTLLGSGAVVSAASNEAPDGKPGVITAQSQHVCLFKPREGCLALYKEWTPSTQLCFVGLAERNLFLAVAAGGQGYRCALLLGADFSLLDRLPLVAESVPHVDIMRPRFSNLYRAGTRVVLCAAVAEGCLHVVSISRRHGQGPRLVVTCNQLCQLLSAEEAASLVVEDVALGPASGRVCVGGLLVGLVTCVHPLGGGPGMRNAACLALSSDGKLSRMGPWFIRNLHPTTTLVHALTSVPKPGAPDWSPSGAYMLLISSRSAQLMASDGPARRAVHLDLRGVPTAAVCLGSAPCVLVADSCGELHVLDLADATAKPIVTSAPLPVASCLAYLPSWFDHGGAAVLVGSSNGSSVLLEVPEDVSSCWQVLPEPVVPSLAPLREAQLIPDPSGCGDARLVCCCGDAPHGRLALAWLAGNLGTLAEGQQIPGQVRLIPLRPAPASHHHTHLLLSFEGEQASTIVLAAAGDSFAEVTLPGLLPGYATLLAAPMPAGHLLQVTPQQAIVTRISDGNLVSAWQQGPISLAALHGQFLALASGSDVHCLWVSSATAKLQQERSLRLEQQLSCLAMFELTSPEGLGEIWLAAGLWVSNDVILQQLSAEQPAVTLSLGPHQPRSMLVAELGGKLWLLVGTATGEVLWWQLDVSSSAHLGATQLTLAPCCWARVGSASVELIPLAAPAPQAGSHTSSILARSDQLLVLSADPIEPGNLCVVRVHGGQGTFAACSFQAEALPPNSLAWVAPSGKLTFGQLDSAPTIRWNEVALGGAPSSIAYLAASSCAAVACSEPEECTSTSQGNGGSGRRSSLRLVDLAAAPCPTEVAQVPLLPGHVVTAVAALKLACSGKSNCGLEAAAATKEFLVVASCHEGAIPPLRQAEQPVPPAGAEDSGVPWWRQRPAQFGEQEQQHSQESAPGPQAAADAGQPGADAVKPQTLQQPAEPQGLLSIFEVHGERGETPGGSSFRSAYQLLLHGTVPLQCVCFSLAAVVPSTEPLNQPLRPTQDGDESAATAAADGMNEPAQQQDPLLVLGCQDGLLRLCRCFVDDANTNARFVMEQGLASIAVIDPLDFEGQVSLAGQIDQQAEQNADSITLQPSQQQQQPAGQLWHQRVALQQIAQASSADGGVIAQLALRGPLVFAADLVSGLTVFRVQPLTQGALPSLVPCSADMGASACLPILPLSDTEVVGATHAQGLVLMHRLPEAEESHWAKGRQRQQQQLEESGAPFARQPCFVPGVREVASLDASATCEQLCHSNVTALVAGELGVPVQPLSDLLSDTGLAAGSTSAEPGAAERPLAAVYATAAGSVGTAKHLQRTQLAQLLRLKHAVEVATGQADLAFSQDRTPELARAHTSVMRSPSSPQRSPMRQMSRSISAPLAAPLRSASLNRFAVPAGDCSWAGTALPCVSLDNFAATCWQPADRLEAVAEQLRIPVQMLQETRQLLLQLAQPPQWTA